MLNSTFLKKQVLDSHHVEHQVSTGTALNSHHVDHQSSTGAGTPSTGLLSGPSAPFYQDNAIKSAPIAQDPILRENHVVLVVGLEVNEKWLKFVKAMMFCNFVWAHKDEGYFCFYGGNPKGSKNRFDYLESLLRRWL